MSKTPKPNQFSSENQPPKGRGKSFKNKLLETVREEALLDVPSSASKERAEQAVLAHMARRAFDPDDGASGMLLKTIFDKAYTSLKAVMPTVEFEYEVSECPVERANQIILAASKGQLPPDVAAIFLQAVKAASDIEVNTELKNRIEKLEAMINGA